MIHKIKKAAIVYCFNINILTTIEQCFFVTLHIKSSSLVTRALGVVVNVRCAKGCRIFSLPLSLFILPVIDIILHIFLYLIVLLFLAIAPCISCIIYVNKIKFRLGKICWKNNFLLEIHTRSLISFYHICLWSSFLINKMVAHVVF